MKYGVLTTRRLLFFGFLLVLSVVLAFIYYNKFYYHEIAAQDLAHAYTKDAVSANMEFLDKRLNLLGQVKSYLVLPNAGPVLELKTYPEDIPLMCYFNNEEDQHIASKLKENQNVSIKGKCLGLNADTLAGGVKFNAISLNPE